MEQNELNISDIDHDKQITTFYLDKELYGIEVQKVQEVTGKLDVIKVPLAPLFVKGLINLRGQIATALGLKELLSERQSKVECMSVVCKSDNGLISIIVDEIGEVVEVNQTQYETTPDHLSDSYKKYIKGIYKMNGHILSLIDLESVLKELSPTIETTSRAK